VMDIARNLLDKTPKEACLACHAYSGGGPGFKRPNISPDMMGNVSESIDIHLAKGLGCIDCHRVEDHKFPTSSVDTWSREGDNIPECSDCHGSKPHGGVKGLFLNRFHERVACQVCHIPVIAGGRYPTDMHRDWSRSEFKEKMARYEPVIELRGNVSPVYAWYNGRRHVYIYPQGVEPSNGAIVYVKPDGSRDDPESKIYPFKLHETVVPYSSVNKTLVPIKVGLVFATGDVAKAIQAGAKIAGLKWDGKFVTLVRYMQVNHGVKPAEEALGCLDCHGPTIRRMPWPELGYGHYPEIAFTLIMVAIIAVIVGIPYLYLRRRR